MSKNNVIQESLEKEYARLNKGRLQEMLMLEDSRRVRAKQHKDLQVLSLRMQIYCRNIAQIAMAGSAAEHIKMPNCEIAKQRNK